MSRLIRTPICESLDANPEDDSSKRLVNNGFPIQILVTFLLLIDGLGFPALLVKVRSVSERRTRLCLFERVPR